MKNCGDGGHTDAPRISRRRLLRNTVGLAFGGAAFPFIGGCGGGSGSPANTDGSPRLGRFVVTDLGTFDGKSSANGDAKAINNNGEVVGSTEIDQVDYGFLWRNGKMTELGRLNIPVDINDDGVVLLGSSASYLWRDGVMEPLPEAPPPTVPQRINNRGEVLRALSLRTPAVWRNGEMRVITVPGYDPADPTIRILLYSMNGLGDVLGAVWIPNPEYTPFTDPGDLGPKPSQFLYRHFIVHGEQTTFLTGLESPKPITAYQLNDRGQILARRVNIIDNDVWLLWQNGQRKDLETGNMYAYPSRMNNFGQIVGYRQSYDLRTSHAALWVDGGVPINLNDRLKNRGDWTLDEANDINDRGQIVGSGRRNGVGRPFLLSPV